MVTFSKKRKSVLVIINKKTKRDSKNIKILYNAIYNFANLIYNIPQMGGPIILKEEINT